MAQPSIDFLKALKEQVVMRVRDSEISGRFFSVEMKADEVSNQHHVHVLEEAKRRASSSSSSQKSEADGDGTACTQLKLGHRRVRLYTRLIELLKLQRRYTVDYSKQLPLTDAKLSYYTAQLRMLEEKLYKAEISSSPTEEEDDTVDSAEDEEADAVDAVEAPFPTQKPSKEAVARSLFNRMFRKTLEAVGNLEKKAEKLLLTPFRELQGLEKTFVSGVFPAFKSFAAESSLYMGFMHSAVMEDAVAAAHSHASESDSQADREKAIAELLGSTRRNGASRLLNELKESVHEDEELAGEEEVGLVEKGVVDLKPASLARIVAAAARLSEARDGVDLARALAAYAYQSVGVESTVLALRKLVTTDTELYRKQFFRAFSNLKIIPGGVGILNGLHERAKFVAFQEFREKMNSGAIENVLRAGEKLLNKDFSNSHAGSLYSQLGAGDVLQSKLNKLVEENAEL